MSADMTSKQRVIAALCCQVPDRVPIDYDANPAIDQRLKQHFGLHPDDNEGLRTALSVDFRGVCADYCGPKLHADIPNRGVVVDDWGIHRRWIAHDSGGYWDYCDFPLAQAGVDEVAQWPMPSPDAFDYSRIPGLCEQFGPYAVYLGNAGIGDIINANGMLRGMEQTLIDLITEEPAGLLLAQRRTHIHCEMLRRSLEAAHGRIDFLWMGEDLGTQTAPMISMEIYRTHIKPLHQQIIDVADAFGIPVMVHSCGSSSWVYEEFIDMGIKAVDTLQPEAHEMAPVHLKSTYGGRLAFHGCISTAGPVATGTANEVVDYCKQTLDVMMPQGGYCFAPTHQLQDNSPTENVIAMYQTALRHGWYR